MTGTTRVARKVAMVGAAALLALAAIAPVGASAAVSYATVYTHVGFSPEANSVEFWQTKYSTTCTKVDEPGGETYTLTVAYSYVITKAGSDEQYANTVFKDPAIGKTVFADTNGDGDYDGAPDDKGISHIIFCGPKATPTGGAGGESAKATLPPTDGIAGSKGSSDSLGLVLMALAGVLAGVMVLTPARARRR